MVDFSDKKTPKVIVTISTSIIVILPEALRTFKRTCEYIFNGPLATKDEAEKVQYLRLWVGDIRGGWALTEANSKILASHWTGFENYAKPKSSFRVSRFQLRAIKQEQNETICAFMTRARIIANDSEYTDKDEQLMDTLIADRYSDSIRQKLITKNKETTLDQALAIVRAYEGT